MRSVIDTNFLLWSFNYEYYYAQNLVFVYSTMIYYFEIIALFINYVLKFIALLIIGVFHMGIRKADHMIGM